MILELALIIAFLATFGVLLACVGTAIVSGQESNRDEMERVRGEFERMVARLGEEEGDPS